MFSAGRPRFGPRFGRNRGAHMVEQLAGALVEAQARDACLDRLRIPIEHVLQVGQVLARQRTDAPHLL